MRSPAFYEHLSYSKSLANETNAQRLLGWEACLWKHIQINWRAENRLKLRTDNSYERFEININKKIFNNSEFSQIQKNINDEKKIMNKLLSLKYSPNDLMKKNIKVKKDGKVRNGFEVLKFLNPSIDDFKNFFNISINQKLLTKIYFDSKYEVFYDREKKSYEQLNKNKNMNLKNVDFNKIPSLSKEILEKLNKFKPENLYDAGKISGITPSALFQIVKHKKIKGDRVAWPNFRRIL